MEVILYGFSENSMFQGILHVCGGDPKNVLSGLEFVEYSPRMWRWSSADPKENEEYVVFSTYVEVILY